MDLQIAGKHFLVLGASSGFGLQVAKQLLAEGATVTVVARRKELLLQEFGDASNRVKVVGLDLTSANAIDSLVSNAALKSVYGAFINGGGPPAASALEASMQQWDDAYNQVLRWKIELARAIVPNMAQEGGGRILFLESISVKQPIENLVLSNALRAAVAGYAKTLAGEVGMHNITVNLLAPGFHSTAAMDRIVTRRQQSGTASKQEVLQQFATASAMRKLGDAGDLASLACWLLSPLAGYITGQTISVDGGLMKGLFG